jgi:hypothetical protein
MKSQGIFPRVLPGDIPTWVIRASMFALSRNFKEVVR